MAQGLTNVRFVGGVLDGQKFMDQPAIFLRAVHKEFTGMWVGELADGTTAIFKSKLPGQNWIQLHQHLYTKGEKDNLGFFVYSFSESLVINRCSGTTKAGLRCQNIAKDGISFCKIHSPIRVYIT